MRHHPSWSEVKTEVMKNTVPIDATCATCRWWHPPAPAADAGQCHRRSPADQGWPTTDATVECGDWSTDYMPEERTGQLTARQTRK